MRYPSTRISDAADTFGGVTIYWVGAGGDNNWSTTANWSTGAVPTASDDVVFDGLAHGAGGAVPARAQHGPRVALQAAQPPAADAIGRAGADEAAFLRVFDHDVGTAQVHGRDFLAGEEAFESPPARRTDPPAAAPRGANARFPKMSCSAYIKVPLP